MRTELSPSEEDFVDELLAWDDSRRASDWLFCNIALIVAGCVIVGASAFALFHLTDDVITGVLVPGFVVGLFLVGAYVVGGKRIRERHQLATILKKTRGIS